MTKFVATPLVLACALALAACSPSPMTMDEAAVFYQDAASVVNEANQEDNERWEEAATALDVEAISALCGEAADAAQTFGATLAEPQWPAEVSTQVEAVIAEAELEAAAYEACQAATDIDGVNAALEALPEREAAVELRALLGLDAA